MTTPNPARVYDYWLGGKDNFAADRELAEAAVRANPEIRRWAELNRDFLGRVVTFLAGEAGISQFIDLGAGLPTRRNVHEIAQSVNPAARVVYVDNDPVVGIHARALLATNDKTIAIQGDIRRPREILDDPGLRQLIDLDQPVAVLLFAVLHFIYDRQDPYGIVAGFRDAIASGSYVAISHVEQTRQLEKLVALYDEANVMDDPGPTDHSALRDEAGIARFFEGLQLVEPGVVRLPQWRPEPSAAEESIPVFGGVGRKP